MYRTDPGTDPVTDPGADTEWAAGTSACSRPGPEVSSGKRGLCDREAVAVLADQIAQVAATEARALGACQMVCVRGGSSEAKELDCDHD